MLFSHIYVVSTKFSPGPSQRPYLKMHIQQNLVPVGFEKSNPVQCNPIQKAKFSVTYQTHLGNGKLSLHTADSKLFNLTQVNLYSDLNTKHYLKSTSVVQHRKMFCEQTVTVF